jgi:diguanylate cyclase (GGDEF)-like protein
MGSTADSASRRKKGSKVLLVGDVTKVFLDADSAGRYPCEVRANILDALDAATRGSFDVVAVVIDGTSNHLGAALKALRKGTSARLVLLAQMYEEPIARRLTAKNADDEKPADAYVICPIRLTTFFDAVGIAASGGTETAAAADGWPPQARRRHDRAAWAKDHPGLLSELERRIRLLERLATTDDLTGLKNRRYTLEFARQILEYAKANDGRVTLLVFDIDNFKHYNDRYGHLAGDEILKQATILMRRCCRPHDVVGRIGGDEFAVVFWDDPHRHADDKAQDRRSKDTDHPTEAILVAKRFQKEFGNAELHLLGPGGEGVLTISGGLASFPRDGSTVAELLERADTALLEAKRSGKNRIYLVGEPQSDIAEIP